MLVITSRVHWQVSSCVRLLWTNLLPIFIGLFIIWNCKFFILVTNPLSDICLTHIFSQSVACSHHPPPFFLMVFFKGPEVKILIKVNLLIFTFMVHGFCVLPKKSLTIPRLQIFSLIFSSGSFVVLFTCLDLSSI